MGGWRSKLIFVLIVYFAGFATAIYFLAPVPKDYETDTEQNSFAQSVFKSDQFAKSFNAGLHKCVDFTKVAVKDLSEFVKEKVTEAKTSG